MNKSRPNKLTFRLSESELQELHTRIKESGYNKQQYLIRAIFSKTMIEKSTLSELLYQLRKIGVNCNQIARACNSGNAHLESDRIRGLAITLEKICQSLRQLM